MMKKVLKKELKKGQCEVISSGVGGGWGWGGGSRTNGPNPVKMASLSF